MKEMTVLFVVCVNNEELFEQCEKQIKSVYIPPGFHMHILPIRHAKSLTSAYNQALSFPAKYKVYLHQDTFIMNPYFFMEMLVLFTLNKDLGLLGVIGCKELPENGIWCEGKELIGQVLEYKWGLYQLLSFKTEKFKRDRFIPVQAIDGLLMATQYDVEWREDVFDGFHFYDISQSLEFQKAGYVVGVANQTRPWCIHNIRDYVLDEATYEKYRKILVEEYPDVGLQKEEG
ncbi:glycosyltransferase family protein [Priestia taiwanensis]|uniref:glycosyltransferase family protein n=1 Tax=Priestia taiwanensis TaxID=1347902 RepID=UPI001667DE48|nr:glycosyltransferase family protein [Priestia taiwanensis]